MKRAICLIFLSIIFFSTGRAQQWQPSRIVKGQNNVFTEKNTSSVLRHSIKNANGAPSWQESFEDWDGTDMFWLPEGWTAQRTEAYMDSSNPRTWTVNKQYNAYYPAPTDGQHYAVIYSNDDAPQDEWLCTPEVTPKEGEYLTYYIQLQPLFLFDLQYFDQSSMSFSQYVSTADQQLFVSVENGEWTKVNSLFDIYKQESVADIYEDAHMGVVTKRKLFIDMTPYVGKKVRFAFRYVGQGGDSMFLDDIQLVNPSIEVGYNLPSTAMYFGMTADFQQPSSAVYLPDGTPLTWDNTSSPEATSFNWLYADVNDISVQAQSSDRNLVTTYNTYVASSDLTTGSENTASLPTLKATGVAGLAGEYTHPYHTMQIGGKAQVMVDGKWLKTGAGYCHPTQGITILQTATGVPFFGICEESQALWTQIFGLDPGDEAHVTGFGTHVNEPAKPYTLRSLTVQGKGKLDRLYGIKAVVLKQNLYGSFEEIGSAVIDSQNITEVSTPGDDYNMYTLPFIFADPLIINKEVWIMIEGLDKAASWFAPLQTKNPEYREDDSHAIIKIGYTLDGEKGSGIYYASNLMTENEQGEYVSCYNNFFVNLNMAYGDCDDWGHVDIDIPTPPIPDVPYSDNEMYLWDYNTNDFAEYEHHPLRCGFYDEEKSEEDITLYVCIGELYEKIGGEFYGEDVNSTYYMRITMPRNMIGADRVDIDDNHVKVDYYSIIAKEFMMHAHTGWLSVKEIEPHVYNVVIEAIDMTNMYALCGKYAFNDAWRWRDFNEKRPAPVSEWYLKRGADITSRHPILTAVVDNSNTDLPVIYFAEVEGLTTVNSITSLPGEQFVRIQMPTSLMDGLIKGFSGWANDDLTLTYNGFDYNHSGCAHDDTCYGGNVQMVEFDIDNQFMIINSTIYTMIHEDMNNLSLHFEGNFVIDNEASGIEEINTDESSDHHIYDITGRRVSNLIPGHIYIQNGKKIIK